MREIVFASTNPAKVLQISGALSGVANVTGVPNAAQLPEVKEDGKTASENARKKALTYASHLQKTVMSMDNALYIDGLQPEEQPGLTVRTPFGTDHRLSDDEMIKYYSALVARLGGVARVSWDFAVCIATPEGKVQEAVIKQYAKFTSNACAERLPGYPLDSLLINPFTGKYVAQETPEERAEFWEKTMGRELKAFVEKLEV